MIMALLWIGPVDLFMMENDAGQNPSANGKKGTKCHLLELWLTSKKRCTKVIIVVPESCMILTEAEQKNWQGSIALRQLRQVARPI